MALRSPEREDQIEQAYDRSFDPASRLKSHEQQAGSDYANAGIDQAEAFANDPANSTKNPWTGKETNNSTGNIDAIKDREAAPSWRQNYTGKGANKSTGFTMKNLKKKGPAGAIIALILGGGVIGTSLLSPALLLVQMKNTFMNDLSDATPAQTIRSDIMMRNKIKGLNPTTSICTNAVSIRCKFSTMSNRQIKKFEKAGFEVERDSSKIPTRNIIKSMTYTHEDGSKTIIKTPQDLKNFARTPEGRAAVFKAFNPKTDYFLNGDFSKMLATKLGLSKESKVKPGDDKEVKSSFDDSTKASQAAPAEEGGRFKESVDDVKNMDDSPKLGGAANAVVTGVASACTLYNTSRRVTLSVKAVKLVAAAAFAMTFLTETDKLIAGDADPSVISQLGSQLTSVDNRKQIQDDNGNMVNNPDYGKSPTDSQGYQLAANNTAASEKSAEKFSLAPLGGLAVLAKIATLPNSFPHGRTGAKYACRLASSGLTGLALLIAMCTGPQVVACIAVNAAVGVAVGVAISILISQITSFLISHYAKDLALDALTYGPDVGNGYFLGASAILGGVAAYGGMMPANKSSLKSYFADTDSIRKQTTAADVYVARATPFDVYNQYSFLGSIVQPLNTTLLSQATFASKVAGLFNLIPSSFASLGTAGAAYNQAAQPYNDQRFSQCNDPELDDIGVNGDEFCNVRYTMSSSELNMDPDENVQYMVNSGVVDEDTGAPRTDTQIGQDYQKFLDNCVNRKDPLGSTSEEIQNEDDWNTGKNCGPESSLNTTMTAFNQANGNVVASTNPSSDLVASTDNTPAGTVSADSASIISNFRVFTMDMQSEDAMDQDPSADSGSGTSSDTGSGNLVGEPANAEPAGQGWQLKDNTDYSSIPCAAGTTDDGTNTNQGNGTTVRVCLLKGTKISSAISDEAVKMLTAAQKDGVNITITSGLRTYAEQVALRNKNCGGSMTIPAEQCTPPTAIPGQSNHEKGTAMDLNATGSNNVSDWLTKNAATYGFYNLPTESWHWSTSGL